MAKLIVTEELDLHGYKIGQVVKINTKHPSYDQFWNPYGKSARTTKDTTKWNRAHQHAQLGVVLGKEGDNHLQVAIHRHGFSGQNTSQKVHKDALSPIKHKV